MSKTQNCFWSPNGDYLCLNNKDKRNNFPNNSTTFTCTVVQSGNRSGVSRARVAEGNGNPFLVYSQTNRNVGNMNSATEFYNPSAFWQDGNYDIIRPLGTYPKFLPEGQENRYLYFPNTLGIRDPRDASLFQNCR